MITNHNWVNINILKRKTFHVVHQENHVHNSIWTAFPYHSQWTTNLISNSKQFLIHTQKYGIILRLPLLLRGIHKPNNRNHYYSPLINQNNSAQPTQIISSKSKQPLLRAAAISLVSYWLLFVIKSNSLTSFHKFVWKQTLFWTLLKQQ